MGVCRSWRKELIFHLFFVIGREGGISFFDADGTAVPPPLAGPTIMFQ